MASTCLTLNFEQSTDWRRSQDIGVGRRSSFLPGFFVPRAIAQEETRFYDCVNVDAHRFVEPAATTTQEAAAPFVRRLGRPRRHPIESCREYPALRPDLPRRPT